ncbi:MAG: hypothetical protein IJ777_02745 [Clostridia bacterium]|nr:hypothetical protein [Clostridia bacterium]
MDSVNAVSIDNALNLMNTFMSKEINLSHCKVIVFSEEIAKRGIRKEVSTLINNVQIRPDSNIIISTCSAEEYLKNVSPSLENLVAKFYEILPNSADYTGYTANVDLVNFFNRLISKTSEPVAILGSISTSSSPGDEELQQKNKSTFDIEGGIKNIGLAVFKDDTMVGKLNATETLNYLMLTNQLKSCNIPVRNPEDENKVVDLFLTPNSKPKIKVSIINGSPYVRINLQTNARISSIEDVTEGGNEEKMQKIKDATSYYLKTQMENYLYRTAKEFHSDISELGKYSLTNFKTFPEFEEYQWKNNYQDAFFDVNVDVSIRSGFLLTGS